MAPPNGAQAGPQTTRKRMIQPVLPALPFSVRPKKGEGRPEQENKQSNEETQSSQSSAIDTNGSKKDETPNLDLAPNNETSELSLHESSPDKSLFDVSSAIDSSQTASLPEASATEVDSSEHSDARAEKVENGPGLIVDTEQTPIVDDDQRLPEKEANLITEVIVTQVQSPEEETKESNHEEAASEVSPESSPSAVNIPVELSAQPTPTISSTAAITPEAPAVTRSSRVLNGSTTDTSEILTNGHGPQRPLPDLNYSRAGIATPTRVAPFPSILDHLILLCNSKHWADWVLEIHQPIPNAQVYLGYAHAFILMRSDRLRKMMAQPQELPYPPNILQFYPARVIQPHAFEAALRFLYSDTVLSPESLFTRDIYADKYARAQMVDYVLSYWMAGIELAVEPVTSRAFTLLAGLTDWEMAELFVKEACSIRSLTQTTQEHVAPPESIVMADSIMRLVFGLFTHQLDISNFKLNADAQPTTMLTRFSNIGVGRPSSNPALAGMVFGSMPSSGTLSPMTPTGSPFPVADNVASIILINLDFADLCLLCREMITYHGGAGLSLIHEAVFEREKRRLAIVGSRAVNNKQRLAKSNLWEDLAYREFIEEGKLQRARVGYLLPSHNKR